MPPPKTEPDNHIAMEFHDEIDIEDTKVMAAYEENSFEYEEVQIKKEALTDSEEIPPITNTGRKGRKQTRKRTSQILSDKGAYAADLRYGVRLPEDNNNLLRGKALAKAYSEGAPAQHQCANCYETFDSLARLRRHERKHMMKSCPICNKTVQVDNLKFHIGRMHGSDEPTLEKRPFQCSHCEKTFYYQNHLLVHEQMHAKKRCPVCGESFRASYLKNHMARKHPSEMALTETAAENRCSACKQTFASKTLLWTHQQMHKKELCTVCIKSFRCDSMKMHMATAHPEHVSLPSAAPTYRCDKCERSFLYKKQLTKHQRCHQMVQCGVCKKSFKSYLIKTHAAQEHGSD